MILRGLAFVATVTTLSIAALPVRAQDAPAPSPSPGPVQLEDVEVIGQPLARRLEVFTETLSNPPPARGLARWRVPVCIAAANFRPEVGAWIADRIVANGISLGVDIHEPDCAPNVVIVGTADGGALINEWVERHPRQFLAKEASTGATRANLARFVASDAPVRWWQSSVPKYYDIMLGRAVPTCCGRSVMLNVFSKSQMRGRTRDDLTRILIVVDMGRVSGVNLGQLADYLSLIAFAQINPDADMTSFDTILNLFSDANRPAELTEWDRAYLRTMYEVPDDRRWNRADQADALFDELNPNH